MGQAVQDPADASLALRLVASLRRIELIAGLAVLAMCGPLLMGYVYLATNSWDAAVSSPRPYLLTLVLAALIAPVLTIRRRKLERAERANRELLDRMV